MAARVNDLAQQSNGRETLLVVDDDPNIHALIDFHLEDVVEQVLHAESPQAGLQCARECKPGVVLLDIDMPGMDGFEVCRQLKRDEDTRDIPVLFLTVERQENQVAKALDSGGTDYVTKPFSVVVLRARVRAALRTKRLIDLFKKEARIDWLTGLPTRRVLEAALERQWSERRRRDEPFAVALLDLDHFKSINDRFGHGVGDEVLTRVGKTLQESLRGHELACRFGGEEFALLLRGVPQEAAERAVNRVLEAIRKIHVAVGDSEIAVAASAGLVSILPSGASIGTKRVLEIADTALYRAKAEGRDRVVAAEASSTE
jgi:diguanylate cyclase (GGDEF)-like protein